MSGSYFQISKLASLQLFFLGYLLRIFLPPHLFLRLAATQVEMQGRGKVLEACGSLDFHLMSYC